MDFWGMFVLIGIFLYLGVFVFGAIALFVMGSPYWFVPILFLVFQVIYTVMEQRKHNEK